MSGTVSNINRLQSVQHTMCTIPMARITESIKEVTTLN